MSDIRSNVKCVVSLVIADHLIFIAFVWVCMSQHVHCITPEGEGVQHYSNLNCTDYPGNSYSHGLYN